MKLSIIIVNYNVKYFLEQCLCSVRAAIAGMEAEVLVVDNHSADGSVEYLRRVFRKLLLSRIRIIRGLPKRITRRSGSVAENMSFC